MIQLKNAAQIEKMKEAGRITGEAIILAGEAVREGVPQSTLTISSVITSKSAVQDLHFSGTAASPEARVSR